jgi:hypothetical protein
MAGSHIVASRIGPEQAAGCGGRLQPSARKVPFMVRLTPEQEAAYLLDHGVSRADLKPEVQAEYDRLLAERHARNPSNSPEPSSTGSDVQADPPIPDAPEPVPDEIWSGTPNVVLDGARYAIGWQRFPAEKGGPAYVTARRGILGGRKVLERYPLTDDGWARAWAAFAQLDRATAEKTRATIAKRSAAQPLNQIPLNQIPFQLARHLWHFKTYRILCAVGAVIFFSLLAYTIISPGVNFQTLRSDLSKVHFPPGYHLVAQHREGTDCHDQCSITQTWAWTRSTPRTTSAACADVLRAMTSAYPDTQSNSPIPAHASCDYYADPAGDSFNPGDGKPEIDGSVQTSQTHTKYSFLIELTAAYPAD